MQYGFVIDVADIHTVGDLTEEAEAAGWDGVFIGDVLCISMGKGQTMPLFDPWIALAVMAMRTKRIRIATTITPLPRRRPWKVAREALTLDHLSNGRLTLGVGLGAADFDGGFSKVGEPLDLKTRAEKLDEGLAIIDGLWRGEDFSFSGKHYKVEEMTMLPTPVQEPRIPIWVVGVWPKPKSIQRAGIWDGVIPQKYKSMKRMSPSEIKEMKGYIEERRGNKTPFDIIVGDETPAGNQKQINKMVRPFQEAGATWWLENVSSNSANKVRERIKKGPPRPD